MNDSLWHWALGAGVLVVVNLWLVANILRTDRSIPTQISWSLIVVLLPLLGWIAWGIAGPRSYKPVSSDEQSK
ncbi:MAG: PLD nuclease N-terminal domain-containing protein [Pseudomonas sp.]|uniref:PLD nuclease N-terminal domain-containing protein n=1 Tax=Pseudomonas sp. TaxID=306 RepID=UPI0033948C17